MEVRKYFCYGCEYFTAMVHTNDWMYLKSASDNELEYKNNFVLTFCTNKDNKHDCEGNTNELSCPINYNLK